jgi:lipoprotein-anchoring transpeptidase ErfK/SrfK
MRRYKATALRACFLCVLILGALTAPALAKDQIAPQQLLALVLTNHSVSAKPGGTRVATVKATRPLGHGRTVLPVLARVADRRGRIWLHVRLPGRTIGAVKPPATGWISATHTELRTTPWHIVVELAARRVVVYKAGRVIRDFVAIVGKPSTPTPQGQFFVEEDLRLSKNSVGAPFALATNDRSNVFQEFEGGPGQIAIHGLDNVGGQLGTAASHGCVRLANVNITWLAAHAGPGTPVTIS